MKWLEKAHRRASRSGLEEFLAAIVGVAALAGAFTICAVPLMIESWRLSRRRAVARDLGVDGAGFLFESSAE